MAKTVVPNVNVVKTKMRKKICIIFIDFFLIFSLGDAREDIIKYVYISWTVSKSKVSSNFMYVMSKIPWYYQHQPKM